MLPFISVILPFYNAERTIALCLEALLDQDYPDFEIIAVNDCSDDDSLAYMQSIAEQHQSGPSLTIINNSSRLGAHRSRLRAVTLAAGPIIAFIDADCQAPNGWLRLIAQLLSSSVVGLGGQYRIPDHLPLIARFETRSLLDSWYRNMPDHTHHIATGCGAVWKKYLGPEVWTTGFEFSDLTSGDDTMLSQALLKFGDLHYNRDFFVWHHTRPTLAKYLNQQYRRGRSRTRMSFMNKSEKGHPPTVSATNALIQIGSTCLLGLALCCLFYGMPVMALICFLPFLFLQRNLVKDAIAAAETAPFFLLLFPLVFFRNCAWMAGAVREVFRLVGAKTDAFFSRIGLPRSLFRLLRNLFARNRPSYLIFFVTARCNARCRNCFYWQNIVRADEKQELDLDQIDRFCRHAGSIPYLTLTGGEPFLRNDLAAIAELFYKYCGSQFLVIPTNGLMPERISRTVADILEKCPRISLKVQLSLDAFRETHDRLRGVTGTFDKVLETYHALLPIRKQSKRFNIDISTVLYPESADQAMALVEFVRDKLDIDNHTLALPRTDSRQPLDPKDVSAPYFAWMDYRAGHALKPQKRPFSGLFRAIYEYNLEVMKKTLEHNSMVLPCKAGRKMLILDEKGIMYPCEPLHKTLGNIKDYDYKLEALCRAPEFRKTVQWIQDTSCFCAWECAVQMNIALSFRTYPALLMRWLGSYFKPLR